MNTNMNNDTNNVPFSILLEEEAKEDWSSSANTSCTSSTPPLTVAKPIRRQLTFREEREEIIGRFSSSLDMISFKMGQANIRLNRFGARRYEIHKLKKSFQDGFYGQKQKPSTSFALCLRSKYLNIEDT